MLTILLGNCFLVLTAREYIVVSTEAVPEPTNLPDTRPSSVGLAPGVELEQGSLLDCLAQSTS